MESSSYIEETRQRVARLESALTEESDRGLILLGASSLEDEMKALLTSYFEFERGVRGLGASHNKKYQKVTKEAFRTGGPLHDFSAKNNLAFLLGLIHKEYDDLESLARIRNKFAHRPEVDSLTNNQVVDLVKRFIGSKKIDRQLVLSKTLHVAGFIIGKVLILQEPGVKEDTKRLLLRVAPPA